MARLLLDENLPRLLAKQFVGHSVSTVQQMGWSGLKNGNLLRSASGQFDVLVTLDRNLPHQQSLKGTGIAVLVIKTRSSKLSDLEPIVDEVLQALRACAPETVTRVGEWNPRSRS